MFNPFHPLWQQRKHLGQSRNQLRKQFNKQNQFKSSNKRYFFKNESLILIPPNQPKEELFWDSAVDAVITDKANVKNPSAKVNSGTSDAEKVNTNGNEKVDKVVNN